MLTSDATVPVANVFITENVESWRMTSLAAISGSFPTVVADSAPKTYKVVQDVVKQSNQE